MDAVGTHQLATLQTVVDIHGIVQLLAFLVRLLDATASGCVVVGDGQSDHRTVRQVDGALHQAFTKGATTYNNTTVMVLNGTRDNLCC